MKTRKEIQKQFLGKFTYSAGDGLRMETSTKVPLAIIDWLMEEFYSQYKEIERMRELKDKISLEKFELKTAYDLLESRNKALVETLKDCLGYIPYSVYIRIEALLENNDTDKK